MNVLCIYHGNCADGFGAAVVVRMALGADNVEFHPGVYQDPPPDVTGRDVLMVDFSYKRPVLLEIAERANTILILDHHKSAQEDLVDLPDNVDVRFDMDHSGAILTWLHFFPHDQPPLLLRHIEDRDLWRFELDGTREIQAALFSYPYLFDVWDQLILKDQLAQERIISALRQEGKSIERKHFKDINELILSAAYRMNIAGHNVPVLNAPYFFSSDAGHVMGKGEPFAACYWDTPDGRVFSLRSADEGLDVSDIARRFGGGGHKHAAGFRIPVDRINLWENDR